MTDYGHDFSCVGDLLPTLAIVSGRRTLAEAVARRLTTPRGSCIDAPNDGLDVRMWLQDDASNSDIAMYAAACDAELLKDERILRSTTTLTLSTSGALTATIAIVDSSGPFALVLAVSGVTVQILSVT